MGGRQLLLRGEGSAVAQETAQALDDGVEQREAAVQSLQAGLLQAFLPSLLRCMVLRCLPERGLDAGPCTGLLLLCWFVFGMQNEADDAVAQGCTDLRLAVDCPVLQPMLVPWSDSASFEPDSHVLSAGWGQHIQRQEGYLWDQGWWLLHLVVIAWHVGVGSDEV